MFYAIIEHRIIDPENVEDLGWLMNVLLEKLAQIKFLMQKGVIKSHWAFKGGHGCISVLEVKDEKELNQILAEMPVDETMIKREIFPLTTLEEAIDNLSRNIIQV
ncbi:MAG: hypothetical protein A2145_05695 [candidate division Zixibacteria bacterium RBG_16_40_9]|nr:MAG: hypothetical protein A2145_05695 [candidate division Zixibacteria bacterium RBG_16_40_9]